MTSLQPLGSLLSLALVVAMTAGCAAQGTQVEQTPSISAPGTATAGDGAALPAYETHPALLDPKLANKTAPDVPDVFKVKFETTDGPFVVEVHRDWSPNGADQFYNLVDIGYFQDTAIFRAIKGFMFQFGIHADPAVNEKWGEANIDDDPAVGSKSNLPGYITFAKTGAPNSRSTQIFINLGNNSQLDKMGFTPFGKVVEGMDVLEKINTEYGENDRRKDIQGNFKRQGNKYIEEEFPNIDYIRSVTLIKE